MDAARREIVLVRGAGVAGRDAIEVHEVDARGRRWIIGWSAQLEGFGYEQWRAQLKVGEPDWIADGRSIPTNGPFVELHPSARPRVPT